MRKLTIRQALDQVGSELQPQYGDRPIPGAELKREVARRTGRTNESGIIPSDFCYNRTNEGIPLPNGPMFI